MPSKQNRRSTTTPTPGNQTPESIIKTVARLVADSVSLTELVERLKEIETPKNMEEVNIGSSSRPSVPPTELRAE